jgi:VIT1/CCC1 family predicted Fe2+/Mn2+ transporter
MAFLSRLHRHLDPADSMGEAIFGLIMVLTFTLGAALLGGDEANAADGILIAAIGCNLAWGIIDAFLYLLGRLYERRRISGLFGRLRSETDSAKGAALLQGELDDEIFGLADPTAKERYLSTILARARAHPIDKAHLSGADLRGAALVFCIVLGTAIPAVLPFLLIDNAYAALRLSNLLLIGSLYVVGFYWGRHVGAVPWQAGCLIMSIGLLLVLIAIPLGG